MKIPYHRILLLIWCLFFTGNLLAQKHDRKPFFKGRYQSIHISRQKAKVVCPVFEHSKYPFQGLGVKIGDPFALTYKLYLSKNFAFSLDGGFAASGLYYKYHKKMFSSYTEADTLAPEQKNSYVGHKVKNEWVVEGKLLYQLDISRVLKGLQWYLGGGVQVRRLDIEYEYLLEKSYNESYIDKFSTGYTTLGPVAVTGIEYSYFDLPISAFMETAFYADMVNDPGWVRFQGGVGLRYIF